MNIQLIDVVRSAVIWGLFFALVLLGLKYLHRFFEQLACGREPRTYADPEIRRKGWHLGLVLYTLVGLELVLGAIAIWGIWLKLPGAAFVILAAIFVCGQIGLSAVERRWRTSLTKSAR